MSQAIQKRIAYIGAGQMCEAIFSGLISSGSILPTRQYRDYMDFIQRFVAEKARELVELVHQAGRKAMMFLGDNWIGTEPYGAYFPELAGKPEEIRA